MRIAIRICCSSHCRQLLSTTPNLHPEWSSVHNIYGASAYSNITGLHLESHLLFNIIITESSCQSFCKETCIILNSEASIVLYEKGRMYAYAGQARLSNQVCLCIALYNKVNHQHWKPSIYSSPHLCTLVKLKFVKAHKCFCPCRMFNKNISGFCSVP